MSKKQSDEDVLAQLREMLGGQRANDAIDNPGDDGGDDGSGSGGTGGSDDGQDPSSSSQGQAGEQQQTRAAGAAEQAQSQEETWEDADELEPRDTKFVAFLQQCENELNALGDKPPRAL